MKGGSLSLCKNLATAGLLAVICACTRVPSGAAPQEDLEFRLVGPDACAGCDKVDFDPTYYQKGSLYLQDVIARSADVSAIKAVAEDERTIEIYFSAESADAIRRLTSANIGREIAVVAGGKIRYKAQIAAPFYDSMWMSGMSSEEQTAIFRAIAK